MNTTFKRDKAIEERLDNTHKKILYTLFFGRLTNGKFNLAPYNREGGWISGGWLPMYALRGPFIGGDSADRRLRELRDDMHWPIIDKQHKFEVGGVVRNMHIYALGVDPATMDWDWNLILDDWPHYHPAFDLIEDELGVDEPVVEPKTVVLNVVSDLSELFTKIEIPTPDQVRTVLEHHYPGMTGGAR